MKLNPALILGLACVMGFSPDVHSAALRVLPLGDSITQSDYGHYSYRYALWKKLVDANVQVDFIGSM